MAELVLALTGATGSAAALLLAEKSPWPVSVIASRWGRDVFVRECGPFETLLKKAVTEYDYDDLSAAVSSGSTPTVGMVILPCSCNTLGEIASGMGSNLISRAAHCHLKERRPLILCVRESPLSLIDLRNMVAISEAGGIIMPMSPPFYMENETDPEKITLRRLLDAYTDRVLSLLGVKPSRTWEDVR